MKKYFRIQGRYTGKTGKPVGIFGLCHHVVYNKYYNYKATAEDRKKFENIDKWFDDNLPNPPFYNDGNPDNCITWFKTESTNHMLEKIRPLMEILDKYHVPHDIVFTDYLEKIVYEDEYQVAVR